ncbi:hypothetical protein Q672_10800 [Marinobacter sp. EVN1]|uniref:TrfB-related DNA-binding protein n=1 Tax=Marinobacter sp. EVN1 TaxID=1397532 RepID=UPI0003B84FE4|nr:TrfB-related DNA-binding protein [Marinobacter sp. EVN1]ERS88337.1 hypothetical protein Q672_10800 [Marinobacter sp. EVN1]
MDMEFEALAKQLSPDRFDYLAGLNNFDPKLTASARRVLVDGESVRVVAEEAGMAETTLRFNLRKLVGTLRESVRLSDEHFDLAVAQMPRMAKHNIEFARRILVDGESPKTVADEGGVSPVTLKKVVQRIRNVAIPVGWRTITVTLPDTVADGVEQMEVEAYRNHLENKEK